MLKLYENIKKRRIALNLSQQSLAELVGYKGRSMVSQIESGLVDLPESMIEKFAQVLHCSPQYLMGWDDVPDMPLSFIEKEVILAYRNADRITQENICKLLDVKGDLYSSKEA